MNTDQTTLTLKTIFTKLNKLSQSQLEELITQAKIVKFENTKKIMKAVQALKSIQKDFEDLDIQLYKEAGYAIDEISKLTPEQLSEVMNKIISN